MVFVVVKARLFSVVSINFSCQRMGIVKNNGWLSVVLCCAFPACGTDGAGTMPSPIFVSSQPLNNEKYVLEYVHMLECMYVRYRIKNKIWVLS